MLAVSLVCLFAAARAEAQATRTWVSGVGDDVNPCSRTAPCKTFAGAISKTAASGEISVLDPGGYGAVTITKAITIDGGGNLGFVLAAGTNGVVVNAGVDDVVILRNLSINGVGQGASPGVNGIRYLSGRALRVENCHIFGFSKSGIDVAHDSVSTPGELTVANSSFTNIAGVAIRVANGAAAGAVAPSASLDHVQINRAQIGVDIVAGVATISNAVISHVTGQAVLAENAAVVNVVSAVISSSGTGVSAAGKGSIVRLANCDIMANSTGVNVAAGATGQRFTNSRILGNGSDVVGTLTIVPNQ